MELKYRIVFSKPVSSVIFGLQSNFSFAKAIQGFRLDGSSSGNGKNTISLDEFVIFIINSAKSSIDISVGLPKFIGPVT